MFVEEKLGHYQPVKKLNISINQWGKQNDVAPLEDLKEILVGK